MTGVTAWPANQCPACFETSSVELGEDLRLCFACRHEWTPSTTDGPNAGATVPTDSAPASELAPEPYVVPADAYPDPIEAARARFVGSTVTVHELEVEGTVADVTGDGLARIEFGSGYFVDVDPDGFSVVAYSALTDEVAFELSNAYMAIAAQIIRAGAETISERNGERTFTLAPAGWLPDEPGVIPAIEHGAGYAIATVALAAGIATDDLLAVADRLEQAAHAAEGGTP